MLYIFVFYKQQLLDKDNNVIPGPEVVKALRHPVDSHSEKKPVHVSYSGASSTLLDLSKRDLHDGVIRSSVHYYNTEDEIEELCHRLNEVSAQLS